MKRLDDLIGRLTLAEKVSLLQNDAPAIQRLHVPKYDFWNECLHGVARAGMATGMSGAAADVAGLMIGADPAGEPGGTWKIQPLTP